jgi:predicted metal-dependent enzyme (double-stranded beta helix superfamily)
MQALALEPLRLFVARMTRLIDDGAGPASIIEQGARHMADLVADDAWLPAFCAEPDARTYRQYLLHCDPLERFSVASFVWGPGQRTPIHDHTVWGLIGVLRGAEVETRFDRVGGRMRPAGTSRFEAGHVCRLSPDDGDVHEVSNGFADQVSVSVHAYGGNIGKVRRHVFEAETGAMRDFISGYSNDRLPNIWAGGEGARP